MKVRHKFWAAMAVSLTASLACVYLISSGTIVTTFEDLEKKRAISDLERIHGSLGQVQDSLASVATDWAYWDDTYRYVQTPYSEYEESNLAPEALGDTSRLLGVAYFDSKGKIVKLARSSMEPQLIFSKTDLSQALTDAGIIRSDGKDALAEGTGLMRLGKTAVLYSSSRILRSDQSGPPAGWLMMLRPLNDKIKSQIEAASKLKLTFKDIPLQASSIPPDEEETAWLTDEHAFSKTVLKDPAGFGLFSVQAEAKRDYAQIGQDFVKVVSLQAAGVGLLLLIIVSVVVVCQVIRPLEKLKKQVEDADDESGTIESDSSLEFSALAATINSMLGKQRESRRKLVESEEALKVHNQELERLVFERTRQIEHQAYHDKLTGLPNRAQFYNRLTQAIDRGRLLPESVALLFLDLDNFKTINDSLGHDMGDSLLIQVGSRLRQVVPACGIISRLGGDEFTILIENLQDKSEAEETAHSVLDALSRPILLGTQEVFVGASIGVVLLDESISTPESLMKAADTAMYHAKALGKFRYVFFNSDMLKEAKLKQEIESAFRRAVMDGEITIHYQPLVRLASGEVLGCEALARWVDPTFGEVAPSVFIAIAEETGLIIPMGWTLLEEACHQAVEFIRQLGKPDFVMSVNLSARQFQAPDLVEKVGEALERTGLPPQNLKLEITESILMDNRLDSIERMKQLKEMGVYIALDDFGTGYSSLSTLHTFPIDTLKIDRSFISQLGQESGADAIVEAILAMANSLQINVTGEGVESEQQARLIKEMGCAEGQGYLFGTPLPSRLLQKKLSLSSRYLHTEERQAA